MVSSEETITRRRLPHWFVPSAAHFVTYRLADTIPVHLFQRLQAEHRAQLERPPHSGATRAQHRERLHKQLFAKYDQYLDQAWDIDWLANPAVAAIIRGNLHHHNGTQYHLLAYCVMPNHVHVLFQPCAVVDRPEDEHGEASLEQPDSSGPLARIMHSLKSYTAHEANKLLKRSGRFWQEESYDHWVRDEDELARIIVYIRFNPVKAKLVKKAEEWFWCSAHDRFLQDGNDCGWLQLPNQP